MNKIKENEGNTFMACNDLRTIIHPGDLITYDSVGRARTTTEAARSKTATIRITERAKTVYRDYVLIEFPSGVRECANRADIIAVKPNK